MIISCSPTYESKGDKAYKAALKTQGDVQRKLRKEAYIYYQKALEAHPDKVGNRLRSRFIEMTLYRAEMVLNEGSSAMAALPLYIDDIDKAITPDVSAETKERYAAFIAALADSSFKKRKLYQGLNLLEKAIKISISKTSYENKKKEIVANFAKENYEAAEIEMINGKTNEDAESLVRAEFMVKVALRYDSKYPGANELLSQLYKENRNTYSAYEAVVIDKPDTTIYDEINKYDILLAVPVVSQKRGSATLKVEMYNYSCNPQRLRPRNFCIVDTRGKVFAGIKSSKIDREIVDQEHEVKMTLRFKRGSAPIKKLYFKSDDKDHYTEKNFL